MAQETDYFPTLFADLPAMDSEAAMKALGEAADAHPQDPRPLLLLAGRFAETENLDYAEAAYSGALLRAPDFAIARFQLGLLQYCTGRALTALTTWGPLVALGEDHYFWCFVEGFRALTSDRFGQAIACLERGLLRNQENQPLNADMARMIDRIRQAMPEQGAAEGSEPDSGGRPDDGQPSHFLLSAYRKTNE